jgi:hypothetical protein
MATCSAAWADKEGRACERLTGVLSCCRWILVQGGAIALRRSSRRGCAKRLAVMFQDTLLEPRESPLQAGASVAAGLAGINCAVRETVTGV